MAPAFVQPAQEVLNGEGLEVVSGEEVLPDLGAQLAELLPHRPVRVVRDAFGIRAVELHVGGVGVGVVPLPVGGEDLDAGAVGADVLLKGRLVHRQKAEEEAALAAEVLHGRLVGGFFVNGDQGLPALLSVGEVRIYPQEVQVFGGQGYAQPAAVIDGHILAAVRGKRVPPGVRRLRPAAAGGEREQTGQRQGEDF